MTLRDEILAALGKIGVKRAGTWSDTSRWSVGDLATDLAFELAGLDFVATAVAEEREACAKLADLYVEWQESGMSVAEGIAATIRGRKS